MNANLNYNSTIGKRHEPYKQQNPLNKLNAINRNQMDRVIPCRPLMDDPVIFTKPPESKAYQPPIGMYHGSSKGLASDPKRHPTNLPILKPANAFTHT